MKFIHVTYVTQNGDDCIFSFDDLDAAKRYIDTLVDLLVDFSVMVERK